MAGADSTYQKYVIKSFKHDGSLHRVWLENWRVPEEKLHPRHVGQSVWVVLNDQTTIVEADGKEWVSKVPAVSFFMPEQWFNVVALMEDKGIRYYCNLASPPYRYGNVLTYIDYDLDVVVLADGTVHELDRDDFKRHKEEYRYSEAVESHVETGLRTLRSTIANKDFPFGDSEVIEYYQTWKRHTNVKDEETDQ